MNILNPNEKEYALMAENKQPEEELPPQEPEETIPAEDPLDALPDALLADISAEDFEDADSADIPLDELTPFERAEKLRSSGASVYAPTEPFSPPAPALPQEKPERDRNVAVALEFFLGLIGFIGVGWIYAEKALIGVVLLIGYVLWNVLAAFLDTITFGIFLCIHIPLHLIVVALTSYILYRYTKNTPEMFGE
jgi:hypothetical protein